MKLSSGKITLIAIVVIIIILVASIVGSYNSLVNLSETVNEKQNQITVQLQRRLDLIPNFVNTVKGYAAHETAAIKQVTDARTKLAGASTITDKANANNDLSGALSRLLVIVENYPNLKANEQFRALSDELAGTENRIAYARDQYNTVVKDYNAKIRSFPTNILANMCGFKEKDYFQPTGDVNKVPSVDFSK